jgi:FkbM family methyltransferase
MPLSIDPDVSTVPQVTLKVIAKSPTGECLALADVCQPLPSRLTKYFNKGDGVIDLGANVGQMARTFASAVGLDGSVLAVEADPYTAMMGRFFCSNYPHIQYLPVAVADQATCLPLYQDGENIRRQSLWRSNLTTDSDYALMVPALPLDLIAPSVPNLAAIKVDIQGAEGLMLAGATETLKRTNLTWCVEIWQDGLIRAGSSVMDVSAIFDFYGWRVVGADWATVIDYAEQFPEKVQDIIVRHRTSPISE